MDKRSRTPAKPVRLQLSRRKGFRLQTVSHARNGLPAKKVDRSTKWGNPFPIGDGADRSVSVRLFARMMEGDFADTAGVPQSAQRAYRARALAALDELVGVNLACWCPDDICHATVLLGLANRPRSSKQAT